MGNYSKFIVAFVGVSALFVLELVVSALTAAGVYQIRNAP
jgi:hypothetical protein